MEEVKRWIAVAVGVGAVLGVMIGMTMWYEYRWSVACINKGGIKMENAEGTHICVQAPVTLIPVAVPPM